MKIRALEVTPADFLLQTPFRTALGQKTVTRNVLVKVLCDGGVFGWGEASGSLAMPEATQPSMTRVLRAAASLVTGQPIEDWILLAARVRKKFPNHPTAVSALECALLDAYCRADGIPLHKFFGAKTAPIQTAYTISALDAKTTEKTLTKKFREGFGRFKIKVTGDAAADVERIRLAAKYGEGEKVIVDANQAWKPEEAIRFINQLYSEKIPVALIEQPVKKGDVRGMAEVRKRSPYPIAADESIRTPADVKRLLNADAADVFNIKIAKLGLLESFKIARMARAAKKDLMIGCMMESALGLATSVFWAIGSGIFEYVDLDSFLLLKPLPLRPGFDHKGPHLFIKGKFLGSGIESARKGRKSA